MVARTIDVMVTITKRRYTSSYGSMYSSKCINTGVPYALYFAGIYDFTLGESFSVVGSLEVICYKKAGYPVRENRISVDHIKKLYGTGIHVIELIKCNVKGIGDVKVNELWDETRGKLLNIIKSGDKEPILKIINNQKIVNDLFDFLKTHLSLLDLRNLVGFDVSPLLLKKAVSVWGDSAYLKVKEDPYRLMIFGLSFAKVDALAQVAFNVKRDDSRRLHAVIVKELEHFYLKYKWTAVPKQLVYERVRKVLQADLARMAFECDLPGIVSNETHYALRGVRSMERVLENALKARINNNHFALSTIERDLVLNSIRQFEVMKGFELTPEQKEAVLTCCGSSTSLISGAAGCGKTTVLEAFYMAMRALNGNTLIHQTALSGKAARRMFEATGIEASTIASFLKRIEIEYLGSDDLIVIDECSMVDLANAYYLFRRLKVNVRVLMVGDVMQLPPVSAGLFFHKLVGTGLPQATLNTIKRQAEGSEIISLASTVRGGGKVNKSNYTKVHFYNKNESIIKIYEELGGDFMSFNTIFACPVTKEVGTERINSIILKEKQRRGFRGEPVRYINEDGFLVGYVVNSAISLDLMSNILCVGDLVLNTVNNYDIEVMNGMVGIVSSVIDCDSDSEYVCIINFDGDDIKFRLSDLDNLVFAYAMTIHKLQGSQFKNVIVCCEKPKIKRGLHVNLISREMLYTAITRASDNLALVGYEGYMEDNPRQVGFVL
jgi:exodeoxyribonuclease V alpha subunit